MIFDRFTHNDSYHYIISGRSQKILVTIDFVGGQKSSSLKSIVPIMRGTHSVVSHSVSMTSNARV